MADSLLALASELGEVIHRRWRDEYLCGHPGGVGHWWSESAEWVNCPDCLSWMHA